MTNILIFGDSITWGAYDSKGGWVERLKLFYFDECLKDNNIDMDVYNLGVSGDTSGDLVKRLDSEINTRLGDEETIIIVDIGINDSQVLNNGKNRFTLEEFKNNLEKLREISLKYSKKIIFVGLTPVDDNKVNPMPWSKEKKSYQLEVVEKFNNVLKQFCNERNLIYVDIFNKFLERDYINLLEDGAHPNSKGHELIFNEIKKSLDNIN